jgi:hypothetical protein
MEDSCPFAYLAASTCEDDPDWSYWKQVNAKSFTVVDSLHQRISLPDSSPFNEQTIFKSTVSFFFKTNMDLFLTLDENSCW